jgi:hypothetical protein
VPTTSVRREAVEDLDPGEEVQRGCLMAALLVSRQVLVVGGNKVGSGGRRSAAPNSRSRTSRDNVQAS